MRLSHAISDPRHRARLHYEPAEHQREPFGLADERGGLCQLGGTPVLSQLADRLNHAIPADTIYSPSVKVTVE
jgi:hypothetical protein